MNPGANIFIAYHDSASTCTAFSGNCAANAPVFFTVSDYFDYHLSCGTHSFNWNFGDQTAGSSLQSPTHTYTANGNYNVSCQVIGPTGATATLTATVHVVGGSGNPPPVTPPTPGPTTPPPSGACSPVISGVTFFIDYVGPSSGCTEYSGDCFSSETLPLALKAFNYDFGCTNHSVQWDFGDNTTPVTGMTASHRYISAGAYNLQVTVTANGQGYLVKQVVHVAGGGPVQPPPPGSTFAFDFTSQPWLGVPNGYVFTAFPVGSTSAANVTYSWNFGDGETTTTNSPTTHHVYVDSKTYNVTLSVSGYSGSVEHPLVTRRRPSHP